MSTRPLSELLSRTLLALTEDYVGAGAGGPLLPSLPMWSLIVGCVEAGGTERRNLPERTRTTKRVVAAHITGGIRRGFLADVRVDGRPGVRLTSAGATAHELWPSIRDEAETVWAKRPGADQGALRSALEPIVDALVCEYPNFPMTYGIADVSIRGASTPAAPGRITVTTGGKSPASAGRSTSTSPPS
jgi:hypothetical protein